MKKIAALITMKALLFSASVTSAQNLVPNWSFEDTIECPPNIDAIDYAIGWSSFSETPNYFNACRPDINPSNSVPNNIYGYQFARTGQAYASILTMGYVSLSREDIGCQLLQPLQIGVKYYVSFYVSKSERFIDDASNKLGILLSTVSYTTNSPPPVNNFAQIYTDSIVLDTLNWFRIEGSFIADSVYKYLIIGNFFTNSQTAYVQIDSTPDYAYYYVDDVYLSDIPDSGFGEIKNLNNPVIQIYPTLTNEWITCNSKDELYFFIYNSLGELCFENRMGVSKINLSKLQTGIYYLVILEKNTNTVYKKIILVNH